jgi:hypothetical protein
VKAVKRFAFTESASALVTALALLDFVAPEKEAYIREIGRADVPAIADLDAVRARRS